MHLKIPIYLVAFFLFFVTGLAFSQQSLEFTGGIGFTAVDIEQIVEIDENPGAEAEDWNQFNYSYGAQYNIAFGGIIGFGAELLFQSFYWYSVRVPYVPRPIYRQYFVEAMKLTPLIRIGAQSPFSLDVGPQIIFFDETTLALMVSGNYNIPISSRIIIPLKVKFVFYDGIVPTIPLSLNFGLGINW